MPKTIHAIQIFLLNNKNEVYEMPFVNIHDVLPVINDYAYFKERPKEPLTFDDVSLKPVGELPVDLTLIGNVQFMQIVNLNKEPKPILPLGLYANGELIGYASHDFLYNEYKNDYIHALLSVPNHNSNINKLFDWLHGTIKTFYIDGVRVSPYQWLDEFLNSAPFERKTKFKMFECKNEPTPVKIEYEAFEDVSSGRGASINPRNPHFKLNSALSGVLSDIEPFILLDSVRKAQIEQKAS